MTPLSKSWAAVFVDLLYFETEDWQSRLSIVLGELVDLSILQCFSR